MLLCERWPACGLSFFWCAHVCPPLVSVVCVCVCELLLCSVWCLCLLIYVYVRFECVVLVMVWALCILCVGVFLYGSPIVVAMLMLVCLGLSS